MRVLLIGYGAIAKTVRAALLHDDNIQVAAVIVRKNGRERLRAKLGAELGATVHVLESVDELVVPIDCALECAGHLGVTEHVPTLLRRGIDVIVTSVGSLATPGLIETLEAAAREGNSQMTLVPGAVAGIDALAAAKPFGLDRVTYTGRKPPLGWLDTPAEQIADLKNLKSAVTLFEGSAREAARLYPKNANVAATIALAGVGLDATKVRLIADPAVSRNVHTLHAEGAFGELDMTISGKPLANNPKTSALAAYSALRALRNRVGSVAI
ncbi:MAG: aspartate dehydrogenase [Burkholderiales bacterium]